VVLFFITLGQTQTIDSSVTGIFIFLSYVVLFAAIIAVLYFVFRNLFKHKDELKQTLITIGLFLGIVLIAFIFADSTEVKLKDGIVIGSGYSKAISTGLNTFYILAIASVGTLVFSNFKKFKK
jgi:branched-subunit amino acid ABC-type transport system permease component